MPPFSVSSGSAAVKLSQFVHLPSSDDAGAESEETGATLDEETSDATDEEDSGADSEDFATSSEEPGSVLDEEGFDSEDVFSELEDFAPAKLSAEELDKSELSLKGVSAAFADEESSPQATRRAAEKATKASTCDLIRGNIPKTASTEAYWNHFIPLLDYQGACSSEYSDIFGRHHNKDHLLLSGNLWRNVYVHL